MYILSIPGFIRKRTGNYRIDFSAVTIRISFMGSASKKERYRRDKSLVSFYKVPSDDFYAQAE